MPRYHFNVQHLTRSTDIDGEELPDNEAAWHQATLVAGEIFKDVDGKFRPGQKWSLEVTDSSEKVLFKIHINSESSV